MRPTIKFLLRCGFLTIAGATCASAQDAPVKIGFIGDFTGAVAVQSQDMFDGFMLVVRRNNGKLGGVPVEIVKKDSQFKPEVGLQVARELVEQDGVPIIAGVHASNVLMAVQKYIVGKEVFLIETNAGPSPIAGELCSPYQFTVSWQNDQAAEGMGQYATEKGYKRIVTLAPNFQAGKDNVAGFKRYFKGEVVDEVYTPLTQMDFSSALTQLSATKPDAVYAFYPGGLGIAFVKQFQQAGLLKTVPLLTTYIADATSLPALGASALGIKSGTFWSPDFDNPSNRHFVADFKTTYKHGPSSYAAQGYDGAQLLDSALAKVGGKVSDKSALMAALKEANFASVRGEFKFNNNNFPIHDMHVAEIVRNGPDLEEKTIATPLRQTQDAYHNKCLMK